MCEHSWRLRGYHGPRQQRVVEVFSSKPPHTSLCAGKGVCRDFPFAYPQQETPGLHLQVVGGLGRREPFEFCREHAGCRTHRSLVIVEQRFKVRCRSRPLVLHQSSRIETSIGNPRSLNPSSCRTASSAEYGSAMVTVADIDRRSPSLASRIPILRTRPNGLKSFFNSTIVVWLSMRSTRTVGFGLPPRRRSSS